MDFDDQVARVLAPAELPDEIKGGMEHRFYEGVVMVAYAVRGCGG